MFTLRILQRGGAWGGHFTFTLREKTNFTFTLREKINFTFHVKKVKRFSRFTLKINTYSDFTFNDVLTKPLCMFYEQWTSRTIAT